MAGDYALGGGLIACGVSIHARAWRATQFAMLRNFTRPFQFTPAHGGRLVLHVIVRVGTVSIHARAWRATVAPEEVLGIGDVSIHARAWRATQASCPPRSIAPRFNSRPRMAGDRRKLLVSCDWPPPSGRPTQIVYHFSLRMCARTALPARKSRLPIVKVHL